MGERYSFCPNRLSPVIHFWFGWKSLFNKFGAVLPKPSKPIGKWGRLYRDFLKDHHPIRYNALILSGQLWDLLAQVNEQAQDRLDRTIAQMAAAESVTEDLKAANPMAWVGAINNIRSRAEEAVLRELIGEEEV